MNIFIELRRRNVFRVCGTYVVAGWFLVQTAFTLESVMLLPEWFDSLMMALAMLGLPIVAVLAWAFELTPEGFKRTEIVDPEESIAATTGKRLDILIAVGLVLIGGLLIADRLRPAGGAADKIMSVDGASLAVLPFANRSETVSDAYFADGIHDELLAELARVSGLEVISRTSVMGYRNTDKRVPQIAEELGVSAILEGAVQRSGERVRISVQLIDGKEDTQLWANRYDRPLSTENIFDIQGEITNVIAGALRGVLMKDAAPRVSSTENVGAYQAYMQGKLLTNPGDEKAEDLRRALKYYDQATSLDPKYAQAWAGKAYARMALYWFHGRDIAQRDAAKLALDQARDLSPNALETHLASAFYLYWGLSEFRAAETAFDNALEVSPGNVDAVAGKAFLTRRLGNFEDAAIGLQKAHRLDPLSYYLIPELGLTYAFLGDFETAEQMVEKAAKMDPDSPQGFGFAAAIAQLSGDAQLAYDRFQPLAKYAPYEAVNYAVSIGEPELVREALRAWPNAQKSGATDQLKYIMSQIRAASILGTPETEVETLKSNLRELYSSTMTWDTKPPEHFVIIPAMLGEKTRVLELAKAYGDRAKDDVIGGYSDYSDIAEALTRVGEYDRAMDFVEKMSALTGPYVLRVLELEPTFKALEGQPRWMALKSQMDAG